MRACLAAALVVLATGSSPGAEHAAAASKKARTQASASLIHGDNSRALVWGKDIRALSLGGEGRFSARPLLFLGYGLQMPGGYDDLAGMDVDGKVAVIARTVPKSKAFASLAADARALPARLKRLEAAGAVAVILLEEGGLRPSAKEGAGPLVEIPVVAMTFQALEGVCGNLAERLRGIRDTGRPASRDFVEAPWTALSLDLERGEERP